MSSAAMGHYRTTFASAIPARGQHKHEASTSTRPAQGSPLRAARPEEPEYPWGGCDGQARSGGQESGHVGGGHGPAHRGHYGHAVGPYLRPLRAEARCLSVLLLVSALLGAGVRRLVLDLLPAVEAQASNSRSRAAMSHFNAVSFVIVIGSFLIVTYIGFASARWRPAENPMQLNEWGLGGRGFGTFVSWFLLGGDIYTAYTFIAVPALVYVSGAVGFYALSYTIMVFPIVFIFGPRLWSVARARGYVSPGDFVRGRHGSQGLGLAVAVTGILATMPYIALQLVGIESVLTVMGVGSTTGNAFVRDLPLIIAFAVVSAYTFLAGLRAPALIAFVKDSLIYVTVIVAILVIPAKLGGWGHIFGVASAHLNSVNPATGKPYGNLVVLPAGQWAYATLALGSALALFVYPHAATGLFAAKRRDVIRRNAALLPAYTLVLGLIALFGYMARATPAVNAGVKAGHGNAQLSVPLLFSSMFPSWFAGVADAAIIIGALVPAAVMSIAAANLFTRTIYKELFRPYAS